MDKEKIIKVWLAEGMSKEEIERKLDTLDEQSDDTTPTLQEFQDRNVAVISAVNDKVGVNSLALGLKKSTADSDSEMAALEARMTAYVDSKFSETLTLNFDDGTNEDVKAGK